MCFFYIFISREIKFFFRLFFSTMTFVETIRIGIDARMFSDAFTGIGRYTFELTKRLFERRQIQISGKKYALEWVIFLNDPEFSAYDFPKHVQKILVNAPHYSLAEQTVFLKKLWDSKCDLVHFTHFNMPIFYRKNSVVTIHDTTLSFFPGKTTNWLKKWVYKFVITNAINVSSEIISVSENTKKDVVNIFQKIPGKITCVWNGLTDDFCPLPEKKKGILQKKYKIPGKYLFYSGVWREHKNIRGLFEAFAKIQSKSQEFSSLTLVLTGNPDEKLLDYAKNLEISESIRVVGKVPLEDLVSLMGGAEAFVFPSLYEGFGLPPLEAMRANVPVVSSNTSAMPEVCGEAAHYFDPYDTDDMAQKISEVLTDENLRKKLVTEGQKRTKMFCWDRCADQTFEIYEKALTIKR